MVSSLHESLVSLVRERPAFAVDLLDDVLHVDVPKFADARLSDPSFTELQPTEYRSDAMILLGDRDQNRKPVLGVVVEAQLRRDARKHFTWPVYVVNARARHKCPVVLIVVTVDADTEQWANETIELGGGMIYRPFVVGPGTVPTVIDGDLAARKAYLAILSAIVHGQGDPDVAAEVAIAATRAMALLPNEQKLIYSGIVFRSLSDEARKVLEMHPKTLELLKDPTFPSYYRGQVEGEAKGRAEGEAKGKAEGEAKGEAKGKAEGLAKSILKILANRGLTATDEQQSRIVDCRDLGQFDTWLDRAFTVATVDELFA